MSKLQALAAARRKKAEEQKKGEPSKTLEEPMAELRLENNTTDQDTNNTQSLEEQIRLQQGRKRKNSVPHERHTNLPERPLSSGHLTEQNTTNPPLQAAPSAFAKTMFASRANVPSLSSRAPFNLPYVRNAVVEATNAFAEPSPDDVVMAAQAKGSTISARPK